MKKALLGTTALVAAGLVAQDARAADPISLSLGGYSYWGLSFADYDDPAFDEGGASARDDLSIHSDTEVHFKGSTVLDNGLEVAVRFELEGEQDDGDQIDEAWTEVTGSFGTLRVGNDDPAAYSMGTAAPYASYIFGLNSPFFAIGGSSTLTTFPHADWADSASLMYFSPVFEGFQFGLSYAPEKGQESTRANGNGGAQPPGGELWSIGARYDGEMGGVGVTASAGYVTWEVEAVMGTPGVAGVAGVEAVAARAAQDAKVGYFIAQADQVRAYSIASEDGDDVDNRAMDSDGNPAVQGVTGGVNGGSGVGINHATNGRFKTGDAIYGSDPGDTDGFALTNLHFNNIIAPARAAQPAVEAVEGVEAVEAVEAVPGSMGRSPTSMGAGLVLSMDGFAFGGSYLVNDSDDMTDDVTAFDLGAKYGEGPWAVSLTYGNMSGGASDVDNNLYRLSLSYGMGAGVSVVGVLGMNEIQHGKGAKMTTGQDSSFLGTALAVHF